MNLKKEYRDFVKKSAIQIKKLNIDNDLSKAKCKDIFKLYQNLYHDVEMSNTINVNDVNHIIINYNKIDEDVELLKKFIKIKNMYLQKIIINSSIWTSFIEKLKSEINLKDSKLNEKITSHLIEKGVYRLLNNTINEFRGCWEIAEFKDDKLKKMEIIEPEHYEFLITYVTNKLNNESNK